MSLMKIGDFIELVDFRNSDNALGVNSVRGISTDKRFIATKANLEGVSLSSYKLVKPKDFAFVSDTSRRGDKMSLAYNCSDEVYLVSSISTVFHITQEHKILPEFLYLWFLRPEFDRYARFHSWGSARETFSFEDMSRIEIPVPDIEIQRQLVNVWEGLNGLKVDNDAQAEPLMGLCMSYLKKLREEYPLRKLGTGLIERVEHYNTDGKFDIKSVRGVSNTKEVIKTRANVTGRDFSSFLVLRHHEFVFNRRTTRNGERLGLGFNEGAEPLLFTNDYVMFRVTNNEELLPEYLYLCFKRDEFDRYVRWDSWGSATEFFNWENMLQVQIPVPPIEVQQAIVDIYKCAKESKAISTEAEKLRKAVAPALIQKAIHY